MVKVSTFFKVPSNIFYPLLLFAIILSSIKLLLATALKFSKTIDVYFPKKPWMKNQHVLYMRKKLNSLWLLSNLLLNWECLLFARRRQAGRYLYITMRGKKELFMFEKKVFLSFYFLAFYRDQMIGWKTPHKSLANYLPDILFCKFFHFVFYCYSKTPWGNSNKS